MPVATDLFLLPSRYEDRTRVTPIGALLAGWIFGGGINEAITIRTFLFSIIGAVILLAIVNLFRRGRVR